MNMNLKQIQDFLKEAKLEAQEEISEIRADGDGNSYAAGYEKGKLDLIREIERLISLES
jgi:hypothetical protein